MPYINKMYMCYEPSIYTKVIMKPGWLNVELRWLSLSLSMNEYLKGCVARANVGFEIQSRLLLTVDI